MTRLRAKAHNEVGHPLVDTYIGGCINVAARVQDVTKSLHRARTLIAAEANDHLCRQVMQSGYGELMAQADEADDKHRMVLHDRMTELNRSLCLQFIHVHRLRGVPHPLPLFRLSENSIQVANPRFEALIQRLTRGDRGHHEEILEAVR